MRAAKLSRDAAARQALVGGLETRQPGLGRLPGYLVEETGGHYTSSEMTVLSSGVASPRTILAVLLVGGLTFGLLAWWASHAALQRELHVLESCRGRYAGARSFRDTTTVDMTYPNPDGTQRVSVRHGSRTCGDLRLAGRLR